MILQGACDHEPSLSSKQRSTIQVILQGGCDYCPYSDCDDNTILLCEILWAYQSPLVLGVGDKSFFSIKINFR